jgi:hypothetical protein
MKAYLITSGVIFGLIPVLHIWRAIEEGPHLAKEPDFIAVTALAAGLSIWAFRLLKISSRR